MGYKWIGAVLIIFACGGFGFSYAMLHKREENALRQLMGALDFMECELQYRLTPLPELCHQAAQQSTGLIRSILERFAQELDSQISPDVGCCIATAMAAAESIPGKTQKCLLQLGNSLGRFDLDGQIRGLEAVRGECRRNLEDLSVNRDVRLRSYQTLGICAGAALAILFI